MTHEGLVLGVLGASGGVGASTMATACAVRAACAGREVVLVDGQPWGGGIEVHAGVDSVSGLRWGDLVGVRGELDPVRLAASLPVGESGLRCLSWAGQPPSVVPDPSPVVPALRAAFAVTVIDLPHPDAGGSHREWWGVPDETILVVDATVTGVGSAMLVATMVPRLSGLVLRGEHRVVADDVAKALRAPVLAHVGEDAAVAACTERGECVGSELGPVTDAADELLRALLPELRVA